MQNYVVKNYQKGFEEGQARIGALVAHNWIWPYAYDLEDLLKASRQPDFDPDTRHYCFHGDDMVGYMFFLISPAGSDRRLTATLEFPRMIPGHEQAAELLMERAFQACREKGVSRVFGRVTTMCPDDIQLAQKMGFTIRDWGYKVYYSYEMGWGRISIPGAVAEEIDPEVDLFECAKIAVHWYQRPAEWCLTRLQEWHQYGVIAHLGMREAGKWVASCLVAPNVLRPSTAANYYLYTPNEKYLEPLLATAVNKCVDHGTTYNLIADLINEHRQFEPVYEKLGFRKVAKWAKCEKILT